MARYAAQVKTLTPANEVIDYMADFRNAPKWDPGTIESVMETAEPVAVGSRFRLTVKFAGRMLPATYHVAEMTPGKSVTLFADEKSFTSRDIITCQREGDHTLMTYVAIMKTKKLQWLFDPILSLLFQRIGKNAEQGLQREFKSDQLS